MNHRTGMKGIAGREVLGVALAGMVVLGSAGLAKGLEEGDEPVIVRASAMGVGSQFVFSRPGSAPVEPPVDGRFGAAGGSLDQLAGNAFGFASSFYPGDTPATPGSVIPLLGFPIGGQVFPADHPIRKGYDGMAGLIPPWPMATQGSYPGDPGRRVDLLADVTGNIPAPLPTELGGMTQETTVDEQLVVAETTIDKLTMSGLSGLNPELEPLAAGLEQLTRGFAGDRPGVRGSSVTIRGLNSLYRMVNEGPRARSTCEVVVREVDFFGGLVELFRVRSHAIHEATAEGVKLVGYGTEVGLARILGLEVTFDDKGAVLADRRVPADHRDAAQHAIDQFLQQSPFRMGATGATVNGTHVKGSAFTLSFDGQEPNLPGISPIGRRTRITWTIGAIDADVEVFAPPAATDAGPGDTLGGADGTVPLSLPGAPLIGAPPVEQRPVASKPATPAGATSRSSARVSRVANPPAVAGGLPGAVEGSGPPPGTVEGEQAAGAVLAAPSTAASGARRTVRAAEKVAESKRVTLLPGVVATDAEQAEIASALEDTGQRLALFGGAGALGGLVVWRRRRGSLR